MPGIKLAIKVLFILSALDHKQLKLVKLYGLQVYLSIHGWKRKQKRAVLFSVFLQLTSRFSSAIITIFIATFQAAIISELWLVMKGRFARFFSFEITTEELTVNATNGLELLC